MPGLVENVCLTGYGYVDPYVKKTRNVVPLFDNWAHEIEERVPPLLKKVDHSIEPTIKQLNNYYDHGIKHAESAKKVATNGAKYAGEIGQDVKTDVKMLVRVPVGGKFTEVKTVSKISEIATFILDKADFIIDRYLPAPPGEKSTPCDKTKLIRRVLSLPGKVTTRMLHWVMLYVPGTKDLTFANLKLKRDALFKYAKAKVSPILKYGEGKVLSVSMKAIAIVEKQAKGFSETKLGKTCLMAAVSTLSMANSGCETVVGKERMQAGLKRIEALIPVSLKPTLSKLASLPAAAKAATAKAA